MSAFRMILINRRSGWTLHIEDPPSAIPMQFVGELDLLSAAREIIASGRIWHPRSGISFELATGEEWWSGFHEH